MHFRSAKKRSGKFDDFFGERIITEKAARKTAPKLAKEKEEFTYAIGKTSLGNVLVAMSEFGIVSVICKNDTKQLLPELQDRFRKTLLKPADARAKAALNQIIQLIENPAASLDVPLDIRGTEFQQRVWRAVRKIPLGETSTYSSIAEKIRAPRAVRAVGSTCTNNHFFMAIPCHRVLHKGESVAEGFAKSSKRQQMLIIRELSAASSKRPTKKHAA